MSFNFVAIDFETANSNMNSACSIGLVEVCENVIVNEFYSLIQPPTLTFNERNIEITNITPDDVKNSPKFPAVWEEIKKYFNNSNIITAYNASFDMHVLKNCLTEYNLDVPNFEYICAMDISSKVCPNKNGQRSLKSRCEFLNVNLKDHHNSLCDAKACAEVIINTINIKNSSFNNLFEFYGSLKINEFLNLNIEKNSSRTNDKKFNNVNIHDITPHVETFDFKHSFYNKNIVFTGELSSISRKDAMQKIVNLGGILKSGVSRTTNYIIIGKQDKSIVGKEGLSTKEKKALELIEKGYNIEIIDENKLLKIIS